jgi:hypothetical protein
MTKRDDAIARNAMDAHYAILSGKPPRYQQEVPEKRTRAKSLNASEHDLQKALISWWKFECRVFGIPEFALFAVPNGTMYRGTQIERSIQSNYLKAEGMRPGALDLVLAVARGGYHGLFTEMKTRTGRISDEQSAFLTYLDSSGYKAVVCRSTEEAIAAITNYLKGA